MNENKDCLALHNQTVFTLAKKKNRFYLLTAGEVFSISGAIHNLLLPNFKKMGIDKMVNFKKVDENIFYGCVSRNRDTVAHSKICKILIDLLNKGEKNEIKN